MFRTAQHHRYLSETGAPHSGAALLRRTSVLGQGPKTLAQAEFISAEHFSPKGEAALWAAEPKKKDILSDSSHRYIF